MHVAYSQTFFSHFEIFPLSSSLFYTKPDGSRSVVAFSVFASLLIFILFFFYFYEFGLALRMGWVAMFYLAIVPCNLYSTAKLNFFFC